MFIRRLELTLKFWGYVSLHSGVDFDVVTSRPIKLIMMSGDLYFVFINVRYADALPSSYVLSSQVDRRDATELFDVLVTQPLRRVQRPEPLSSETIQPSDTGSRRLIVLDGVDECESADREILVQLISKFDLSSPDWLYLLVTVRDDDDDHGQLVSQLGSAQKLELKAGLGDAETVADVRRYLSAVMSSRIDRISLDGALAQLAKNAEANFLCAKFLQVRSKQ